MNALTKFEKSLCNLIDYPLTYVHLRFNVVARSPVKLGGYQAGERLRDALAGVMLQAACPENPRRQKPDADHAAVCPICWLLAADANPGEVRRAYALAPPYPVLDIVRPGETFSFTLTLFGDGVRYLPFFVLAVPEMGRRGVGPGRGGFELISIEAVNPLTQEVEIVLKAGENVVYPPSGRVAWQDAGALVEEVEELAEGASLGIRFLSPTRLIEAKSLARVPDFRVFFGRLLERMDELNEQFGGGAKRGQEAVQQLYRLADQVRLVDMDVKWVELWGPSGRTGKRTPMGGFVGRAVYHNKDWGGLLPWLLFGQGVQVGKLAAKGNGVFQVEIPGIRFYWT